MNFSEVEESCERLRGLMARTTGRDLVASVSLEPPVLTDAKGRFVALVLWAYAFWYEACQPAGNALKGVVRNVSADDFKRVNEAGITIQHLRTVQAHNLLPSSKTDAFHQKQAEIWLLNSGGNPPDWNLCFEAICRLLVDIAETLSDHWTRIVSSEADAAAAAAKLLDSIDRELPPHHCDAIVEAEAIALKLDGFDVVAFRKTRLDAWRTYYRMFAVAEDGRAALERVIRTDLRSIFGTYEDGTREAVVSAPSFST